MENLNIVQQNSFGQEISIKEADKMVKEFLNLKKNISTPEINDHLLRLNDENEISKTNTFIATQTKNAFIFSKKALMRFFDGSETDSLGNPESANYLMIVLGAHDEPKEVNGIQFDAGSFTVIALGCRMKENNGETFFHPLSIEKAASEYPPTLVQPSFLPDSESGENRLKFTII